MNPAVGVVRETHGGYENVCGAYRSKRPVGCQRVSTTGAFCAGDAARVLLRRNGNTRDSIAVGWIGDLPVPSPSPLSDRRGICIRQTRRYLPRASQYSDNLVSSLPLPACPSVRLSRRSCVATKANRPPALLLALQKSHRTPGRVPFVVFSLVVPLLLTVPSTDARRPRMWLLR